MKKFLSIVLCLCTVFVFGRPAFAQGMGDIPDNPGILPDIFTYSNKRGDFSFEASNVAGVNLVLPTSLDFGPDGRLYIAQKNGLIIAYDIVRNGPQDFTATNEERIFTLKLFTSNHDDDGMLNDSQLTLEGGWILDMAIERQVTGILVEGTAESPVIYATSSDPRAGAGPNLDDSGLDTNSGVVHRITRENGVWKKVDLVRGLPRNEENHSVNGLQLDEQNNILYVAIGGMTNAGSPSNNFALVSEYAMAAAILSIDLDEIDALPVQGEGDEKYIYDMPTLDDPTRANANGITDPADPGYDGIDVNDPFGGNNGLNQAKVIPDGPVQLHATGLRNPYDIVLTRAPGREGRLYTVDNGANMGWGGFPSGEIEYPGANAGTCTNDYDPAELGSTSAMGNDAAVNNFNGLHYIREVDPGKRYYAGHPAPVRANPTGAGLYTYFDGTGVWRNSTSGANPLPPDWPPVPESEAYTAECDFRNSGVDDGAIANYTLVSVNGIAEYLATTFNGALVGSLISVNMNGDVYIAELNPEGDAVINGDVNGVELLFPNIGGVVPLDITTQDDNGAFPGTIWTANYQGQTISVFEPIETNVAVEDEDYLPDSFTLRGNYPNPFNQSTSIVFDLPQSARVRLDVYDSAGRRVLSLPEEVKSAGASRQIQIKGSALASGDYFYRLTAEMPQGAITKSGHMTLVK